jgi:hypothetical protein
MIYHKFEEKNVKLRLISRRRVEASAILKPIAYRASKKSIRRDRPCGFSGFLAL